ncbi:putative Zn-dependent peptidase [Bradyrhizobium sp. i1.15.2]
MLKDNKDEAFDLLRMALTSPRFDAPDAERIRAAVLANLRRDSTNPSTLADRKFFEVALNDHPYGRQAGGTFESVAKIDVADMKDYVRRLIAKDTLKIAVVGDVDRETLGNLLDKTFGSLPAKAQLTEVPDVVAPKPPQRVYSLIDVPQTVVSFGGPGRPPQRAGFHGGRRRQPDPRRRDRAGETWRRSTSRSAAWPRKARPSRSLTRPSRT